jgi:hypothetical protein
MDEAIEALERGGEGEEIGYVAIAKKFGVDESTLRRRHQGKCSTCNDAGKTRDPNIAWSHSEAYGSAWENRNLESIDT